MEQTKLDDLMETIIKVQNEHNIVQQNERDKFLSEMQPYAEELANAARLAIKTNKEKLEKLANDIKIATERADKIILMSNIEMSKYINEKNEENKKNEEEVQISNRLYRNKERTKENEDNRKYRENEREKEEEYNERYKNMRLEREEVAKKEAARLKEVAAAKEAAAEEAAAEVAAAAKEAERLEKERHTDLVARIKEDGAQRREEQKKNDNAIALAELRANKAAAQAGPPRTRLSAAEITAQYEALKVKNGGYEKFTTNSNINTKKLKIKKMLQLNNETNDINVNNAGGNDILNDKYNEMIKTNVNIKHNDNIRAYVNDDNNDAEIYDDIYSVNNRETQENNKLKKNIIGESDVIMQHNNTNVMRHKNTGVNNLLRDTFDKMDEKKYFNILGKIKNYNDYKLYVISPKKFNNKMRILNETENNEISEMVMFDISNKIEIENMNYVLKRINNINENNNKLNNNSEIYKLIIKLDEISEDKLNEIINHYNNLMLSVKQKDIKLRGVRKKSKQRLNKLK